MLEDESKPHVPYADVNGTWPAPEGGLPKLDSDEAVRATRLLIREGFRFHGIKRRHKVKYEITSGNRHNKIWCGVVNPDQGWHSLVHSVSHFIHRRAMPGWDAHQMHAMTEKHLIAHVVAKGWLTGALKREPKAKPALDVRAVRKARVEASLARWNTKAKRAATAIKKLRRTLAYYERHA